MALVMIAAASVLTLTQPLTLAATSDCAFAIDQFVAAYRGLSQALRLYATCLSEPGERDGCTAPFFYVTTAHNDYAAAKRKLYLFCGN